MMITDIIGEIYLDDGASGRTVYSNLIVICIDNGFMIGGGRDNYICNNIPLEKIG